MYRYKSATYHAHNFLKAIIDPNMGVPQLRLHGLALRESYIVEDDMSACTAVPKEVNTAQSNAMNITYWSM